MSSTTGMMPTSISRMRRATSARVASGVTASGFSVMISLARIRFPWRPPRSPMLDSDGPIPIPPRPISESYQAPPYEVSRSA
jgi:hypothetical protein